MCKESAFYVPEALVQQTFTDEDFLKTYYELLIVFLLQLPKYKSHFIFNLLLYVLFILCARHLLVRMSVHHLHGRYWWRLEKGIGISGP